jgi:hypothetical protein
MNMSLILFFKLEALAFVYAEAWDCADLTHFINIIINLLYLGSCLSIWIAWIAETYSEKDKILIHIGEVEK